MPSYSIISFDIDGTLTLGHGWYYLASALGREGEYRRTMALYTRGTIGEDTHLTNLLNIAAGFRPGDIEAALRTTPRLENISRGMEALRRKGMRTYLLTHNPAYICGWYVREFGMDGYRCARQVVRNGAICNAAGVHADKVAWMRDICSKESTSPANLIHVGDGLSDCEVFRRSGMGIALNTRLREVRRSASTALNTTDMMDVVRAVAAGSQRRNLAH